MMYTIKRKHFLLAIIQRRFEYNDYTKHGQMIYANKNWESEFMQKCLHTCKFIRKQILKVKQF